jgi:hypothetical protein
MKEDEKVYVRGIEHLTPKERHRAERAAMIYEQVARDLGLKKDFFGDQCGWLEFMETDMSEARLWDVARDELSSGKEGKEDKGGSRECSFHLT